MTGEQNKIMTSLDKAIELFRVIVHEEFFRVGGNFEAINWHHVAAEYVAKVKAEEQSAMGVLGADRLTDVIFGIFREMRGNCSQISASLH